ncbi:MAG: sodium:calcium antiporter [Nitrososphaeraceae archaeon]
MSSENLSSMIIWLAELIVASWALSYGAEHLSARYGAKFVGRTILSVATTLPEIAIVIYAAAAGSYGVAIGAGLGSNLLMMTLGLSIMLIIATTRISKAPLSGINVSTFKLDKIFLLVTAIVSALLFIDGYNFLDGLIFTALFIAYLTVALFEMRSERNDTLVKSKRMSNEVSRQPEEVLQSTREDSISGKQVVGGNSGTTARLRGNTTRSLLVFIAGTIGIVVGAGPFIHALEGFSVDIGVSVIILAVIISPIAGEMPEKISLMLLARKGALGASIAIANVLGSKILNNTLLLAVAVFGAVYHAGFLTVIEITPVLAFQVVLVTIVTIIALIPMFKKEIGLKTGMMLLSMYVISIVILLSMYVISIVIQFSLPHE